MARLQLAFDVLEQEKEAAAKRGDFEMAADLRGGAFRLQQIAGSVSAPQKFESTEIASPVIEQDAGISNSGGSENLSAGAPDGDDASVAYKAAWDAGFRAGQGDAARGVTQVVAHGALRALEWAAKYPLGGGMDHVAAERIYALLSPHEKQIHALAERSEATKNHSPSHTPTVSPAGDQETPRCVWTPDEDGIYDTSCGNRWFFDTGTATENEARFCPYCGLALEDRRTPAGHSVSAEAEERRRLVDIFNHLCPHKIDTQVHHCADCDGDPR